MALGGPRSGQGDDPSPCLRVASCADVSPFKTLKTSAVRRADVHRWIVSRRSPGIDIHLVRGPRLLGIDEWALFVTTPLVVAGHNWPVFLNFRGGKGAAAIFGISLVIVPWLTVITAGPSILVMLLLRNVVLGAAFGFILLNTLLWVTGQGAQAVGLCLLLTLLVTGTYVLNVRNHILSSIKARQWRELFLELAG